MSSLKSLRVTLCAVAVALLWAAVCVGDSDGGCGMAGPVVVCCDQTGGRTYVGEQVGVGLYIRNLSKRVVRVEVSAVDNFPRGWKVSREGKKDGNPAVGPMSEAVSLEKEVDLQPEGDFSKVYYPLGIQGGWRTKSDAPSGDVLFDVSFVLNVDGVRHVRVVGVEVLWPSSEEGRRTLEAYWRGDLCDAPNINYCLPQLGKDKVLEKHPEILESEYCVGALFGGQLFLSAESYQDYLKQAKRITSEGNAEDVLREWRLRAGACSALAEEEEALLCLFQRPYETGASGSWEELKVAVDGCGPFDEYVRGIVEYSVRSCSQ